MENMKFCQSCAMPMGDGAEYGTESDGSKSSDYCSYCYKDGEFTAKVSMEEMINICVGPMVEHNENMTEEQAKAIMNEHFPKLKRWAE